MSGFTLLDLPTAEDAPLTSNQSKIPTLPAATPAPLQTAATGHNPAAAAAAAAGRRERDFARCRVLLLKALLKLFVDLGSEISEHVRCKANILD